jgi:serine/threonine protein kinase
MESEARREGIAHRSSASAGDGALPTSVFHATPDGLDRMKERSMNRWVRRPFLRRDGLGQPAGADVPGFRPAPDTFFRDAVAGWNSTDRGSIELIGDRPTVVRRARVTTGDGPVRAPDESVRTEGPPASEPPRTTAPRAGDELAGFRVLAVLGRGAEGTVYLATQTELADRPVVLKVSPLQGGEHRSLARLQHTHIVPILSSQDLPERGLRVLCLPYMGGTTLERLLDELANRPPDERSGGELLEAIDRAASPDLVSLPAAGPAREFLAVETYERSITWIGLCLAEALHHAHLRNLVHWDVKPANVLLAADGMPLLLDFHPAQPPLDPGGAAPEWIGGTPPYIAPEQFAALVAVTEGRRPPAVDARADVYSLAMVLHIALAGERPSCDGRIAARLRRANHRISPGLAAIIERALATHPRQRYPSAASFAEDLRRHLDDRPLTGVANRSLVERWIKWHRHHPVALARAGAIMTALLGFVAAGSIAWFAANRRLNDAMGELEQGRIHLASSDHHQAAQSFDHGLLLLDSATRLDRLLPEARETRDRLIAARERNRRSEMAVQLHSLADRVRFLYATGPTNAGTARKLEARLAAIWRARGQIDRTLADVADERARSRLRADLLDLAILWAELRVELADESGRPEAHRQALRTLAEAEADWGPSPVLSQERRFHAEAVGRREAAASRDAGMAPRTAWVCYALGRALLRDGDLEPAAVALDRAVALEPQSLWAQFFRGRCALLRNRHAEAVDAFGACVALAPEAVCYYNRSLAYAGLGDRDRARLDRDRARELDPGLVASPPRPRRRPVPR